MTGVNAVHFDNKPCPHALLKEFPCLEAVSHSQVVIDSVLLRCGTPRLGIFSYWLYDFREGFPFICLC